MKEKMVYAFLVLFIAVLAGAPVLHAETDDSATANQTQESYSDSSAFDGGIGSAPNENFGQDTGLVGADDSSVPDAGLSGADNSSVPNAGSSNPVGVGSDQEGNNSSY